MARDEELMSQQLVVVDARQSYKLEERSLLVEEAIVDDERIDIQKKREGRALDCTYYGRIVKHKAKYILKVNSVVGEYTYFEYSRLKMTVVFEEVIRFATCKANRAGVLNLRLHGAVLARLAPPPPLALSRLCCMSPMDSRGPWATRVFPWATAVPHGRPQSPMGWYRQQRYRVTHVTGKLVPR